MVALGLLSTVAVSFCSPRRCLRRNCMLPHPVLFQYQNHLFLSFNLNVVFQQQFGPHTLIFEVWDANLLLKDKKMGTVTVNLQTLQVCEGVAGTLFPGGRTETRCLPQFSGRE